MKIDKMAKHPRQGVDLPRRRWRVMNVIKPTIAEKVQIAEECMAFRGIDRNGGIFSLPLPAFVRDTHTSFQIIIRGITFFVNGHTVYYY
jgi:hypothetical protein